MNLDMRLVLLFIFPAACLWGQAPRLPETPDRQAFFGKAAREQIASLAADEQGRAAAVGTVSRGRSGGEDIYFLLLNSKLEKLHERHIGRRGDDGAHHIVPRPEGGFLVAGYSESPPGPSPQAKRYFGERDGWLLWLDHKGETEAEFILGTSAQDEFTHVISLIDGGYIVAGSSNGHAWALRLSRQREIVWEKKWRHEQWPTFVRTALLTSDGQIYLGGYTEQQRGRHGWLAALSLEGNKVLEQSLDARQAAACQSLVEIDAVTLALAGEVNNPQTRDDGFFCKINRKGNILAYTAFGGREHDRVFDMKADYLGGFLLVGESYSFDRGARRSKAWAVVLDAEGRFLEERFYGSKLDERAQALLQLGNGNWLCAGMSGKQLLNNDQAWIIRLDERGRKRNKNNQLEVQALPPVYPNGQFLQNSERAFLPLKYQAPDAGIKSVRAIIRPASGVAGDTLERQIALGPLLAGRAGWLAIPLLFEPSQAAGIYSYSVQLMSGSEAISEPLSFEARYGKPGVPSLSLEIAAPLETTPGATSHSLPLVISNLGDTLAAGVSLFVSADLCWGLPPEVPLGDIPPGGKLHYRLSIMATKPDCAAQEAMLSLRVADASLIHTAAQEVPFNLLAAPGATDPPPPSRTTFVVATWISPNPDQFERNEILWHAPELEIQIKVVSSHEVGRQHFCLSINGQPCDTGAKFDEVSLRGSALSRTFSARLKLREGVNLVKAMVENQAGRAESEELRIIYYTPSLPNLHVLAIGVPSYDLKYTAKDARDFAKALARTAGLNTAFQHVFIDTLAQEEKTTKTAILKNLRRLQYRSADKQIRPQDLLVVFVSSHGLSTPEGRFRIAASDFDSPFLRETSLDFEAEVVGYLKDINCQKLFLIDACHSGSASSGPASSRSLAEWAANQGAQFNLLLSCQADEYSYEDDKWQNGAFTKALLQSLEDFKSRSAASPDLNSDGQLDLQELYQSLSRLVPALVASKKPKAETTQRPLLNLPASPTKIVLYSLPK